MPEVIAISSFEHYGPRKRNDKFKVSEATATDLERANLVRRVNPTKAVGGKSSASPAAQASPKATAKKSGVGGKGKKAARSSS